jgi:hypothetical protein
MCKRPKSRVVCLGDAPTPMTGIGTSITLIVVYVLAGELSKLGDGEFSKVVEACERTRRPFIEEIQSIPFFLPAIAYCETAWKRWLLQSLYFGSLQDHGDSIGRDQNRREGGEQRPRFSTATMPGRRGRGL